MFFSGDPSTRKRVDLGGRSSKERDTQKLVEQARQERSKRLRLRQQNSAALKIQKCFRGRKAVKAAHSEVREQFFARYGKHCENVDRPCFGPKSDFLRQLLFFCNAHNNDDLVALIETCRLLYLLTQENNGKNYNLKGDIVKILGGADYLSNQALTEFRVKRLVFACIQAVYKNKQLLNEQPGMSCENSRMPWVILIAAVLMLLDPELPWSCKVVDYLLQRNALALVREITITGKESLSGCSSTDRISSIEQLLVVIASHNGQAPCSCASDNPWQCFTSQILTVPFVWRLFPHLKEVFAAQRLSHHYIHLMTLYIQNHVDAMPVDIAPDLPSFACLLGNILEIAPAALSSLPIDEDEMETDDVATKKGLHKDLELQISKAIDPPFLMKLINVLFGGISPNGGNGPSVKETDAVIAACSFLQVIFETFPMELIMTVLAYRTDLVPVLWRYMKWCYDNQKKSAISEPTHHFWDGPGWLLPLAVFCPIYKHMLTIIDNEEFYEQEKPLPLHDIKCLIIILKQTLWQLLWVSPTTTNFAKSSASASNSKNPQEVSQHKVGIVAAGLLSQLQDWNNRRQFTLPSDFNADGVNELFISQATMENTRAAEILKQAPFLVPFTSRVKIFTSQLAAGRKRTDSHGVFVWNRFRIRRNQILEDGYNQLSALTEEDLQGPMRVSYVNEFGVEEAGIDGGGIFKDFMEKITRAAFDVQYGLFKETSDHLLYPNPASGMIHEQHLQYFHFLGTILAKAMFEGILVDVPFATFFLSKLKQKYNYLNDLPSLDPELYRHLIFLKNYKGDISELELYFVIVNNEYGEQTEEELLPDGKNKRVTNDNVIPFIHLVANHRLNSQIRQQSSHFLRGFQQLIRKDWIDMFNEHELQLLISGSLDGLDIDDLRAHTNYAGGYNKEHYIIEMFWEVLKGFSLENQMNFLKFVTGCSRGPLLGFQHLEPWFCIQRAGGDASEDALSRLPTSATCMNLLKLPPYRSKEQLEKKLLYAINAQAGFDLS
uniref:HECT-type E3 ubiquitin transferase n=1 Tax=Kalanchoe fedtschenkoi TaxID=63787 RepID=A0A7N0UEM1_KALFE